MSPNSNPDPAQEVARDRIERFIRRFGEPYRRLAWYAALPLILTPELLDYLRLHFLGGRGGVPWIAEADLLLSDLCRPVGYEQFALDQPVRAALIAEMRAALGPEPLREAAFLLLRYVRHLGQAGAGLGPRELEAEQWSAMAYLDEHRGQVAREITAAFATSLTAASAAEVQGSGIPSADLARLARIADELAPNLTDHTELIEYAAEVAALLRDPGGLRERLAGAGARTKEIAGVSVPVLKVPSQTTTAQGKNGVFQMMDPRSCKAIFAVMGVGDAGGQVVKRMGEGAIEGVDLYCVDTSIESLGQYKVKNQLLHRLLLGESALKGQGTDGDPELGRRAADEDRERIRQALQGTDMLFLIAGMGGGTGTGACPVIAEVAKELGVLTIAIVSKPFLSEGKERMMNTTTGIDTLAKHVDNIITMPNENVRVVFGEDNGYSSSVFYLHEIALNTVRGITDLIIRPGLINTSFKEVKTVIYEMGIAMMGTGKASGENRARVAADAAIRNPLLDIDPAGAKGILVNITSGMSLTMGEFDEVGNTVRDFADDDATVVLGTVIDSELEDELRVTVIATGLGARRLSAHEWSASSSPSDPEPPTDLSPYDAPPDYELLDVPTFLRQGNNIGQRLIAVEDPSGINIGHSGGVGHRSTVELVLKPSVFGKADLSLDRLNPPRRSGKGSTDAQIGDLGDRIPNS